jgi:hypothetical protein
MIVQAGLRRPKSASIDRGCARCFSGIVCRSKRFSETIGGDAILVHP